jgi:putative DNA primase/helicase
MTLDEVKAQKRWVLWRYEKVGERDTKVPYQASGLHARSDAPQTWSTWLELQPFVAQYSGVGIMLGNPLGGADLDHCVEDGKIQPWAQDIITRLNSYTEISPSGTGIRILTVGGHGHDKGRKLKRRETEEAAEVYDNVRFLTFTGNHVSDTPVELCERGTQLAWLWEQVDQGKCPPCPMESIKVKVSRADFDKLNAGDWSAYGSQSDAVPSFVYLLCKRYENDEDVDRAFRDSGMFSDKWADGKWDRLGAAEIKRARAFIEQAAPLPRMTHGGLAEAFLRDNRDFLYVYDTKQIAQWVKTRWDLGDKNDDRLLFQAAGKYLGSLWERYAEPEDGKPDPRRKLEDANMVQGVVRMAKVNLPVIPSEKFDSDPYLLGLPNERVIDLHTAAIRDLRREDYITQRVYVSPDANCPTRVFDRFLDEITLGDSALAAFLVRLGSLCLTSLPWQNLFFLIGSGRNGKGVYGRLLTKILGRMSWSLRPAQLTASRFNFDDGKRMLASFQGKRLITCNESIGGNLNLPLLKMISGGDALVGAKMRQDEVQFTPTHKVLLPTNEKPQLPADNAFLGRTRMVPFNASFVGREDRTLEDRLERELPGILHRLIATCPDVISNGLREPACVLEHTANYFQERDIAKQFADDCLNVVDGRRPGLVAKVPAQGGRVRVTNMEERVGKWLSEQRRTGVVASNESHDTQRETILRDLAVRFPKVRARDGSTGKDKAEGNARVWWYTGCELCTE